MTFDRQEDCLRCIIAYKDRCCYSCRAQEWHYFPLQEKNMIKVRRAPEPSNIIFENLKYDKWSRCRRKIFATLISIIFMVISFGGVYLAEW